MNKLLFFLWVGFCYPVYAEQTLSQSRDLLTKYGLAYCVDTFGSSDWVKKDLGSAQGVYFQAGSHHGDAYEKVRSYIKSEFPKIKATDSLSNSLISYKCLELYHAKKYRVFIRKLDKYYRRGI